MSNEVMHTDWTPQNITSAMISIWKEFDIAYETMRKQIAELNKQLVSIRELIARNHPENEQLVHGLEKSLIQHTEAQKIAHELMSRNPGDQDLERYVKDINGIVDALRLMNNIRLGKLVVSGANGEVVSFNF